MTSWEQLSTKDQLPLLTEAVKSEAAFAKLQDALTPLVEAIASRYVKEEEQVHQATEVAFEALRMAVDLYIKNLKRNKEYRFTTYFSWFAKTAIETWLDEQS